METETTETKPKPARKKPTKKPTKKIAKPVAKKIAKAPAKKAAKPAPVKTAKAAKLTKKVKPSVAVKARARTLSTAKVTAKSPRYELRWSEKAGLWVLKRGPRVVNRFTPHNKRSISAARATVRGLVKTGKHTGAVIVIYQANGEPRFAHGYGEYSL